MSIPTEARLQRIAAEQLPGWEYLLFAARLDAGETALAHAHDSVDMTGRAFETARNLRKAIERLQRDNQEAAALVDDIERIFDSDEMLETFGAPGEPGDEDRILALAEVLIMKRDRFRHWTNRAHATTASDDLAVLLAAHAALLDQPSRQLEEYIELWIELGEQLPQLLSAAEQSSAPLEIEMALIITVDDHALERFMDEIARLDQWV